MCKAIYLILSAFAIGCVGSESHPSDQNLRDRFALHRQSFDELVRVFQDDLELESIYLDMSPESLKGQDHKLASYRLLMKSIGVRRIIRRASGDLAFIVSEFPLTSAKGFEYTLKPHFQLVASLDTIQLDSDGYFGSFISDHWYLYLQSYIS
jgi:hypothetical protein